MPFDAFHPTARQLQGDERLADLGAPNRVWAVGPLYGRYGALCQMHEVLARRFKPRDRLIYTGNYLGTHGVWTGESLSVIDELIAFRNAFIAIQGFFVEDIVFLKGPREDLLLQLTRLPFQKNPSHWLGNAMHKGIEGYITAYGGLETLYAGINDGTIKLNRWAHGFQASMQRHAGHVDFFKYLSSCAVTRYRHTQNQIACVPVGLDPSMPLALQYDELVWPTQDIALLPKAPGFSRILRGQSFKPGFNLPSHENRNFVVDLDGGDGLEGKSHMACFDPQGQLLDMVSF